MTRSLSGSPDATPYWNMPDASPSAALKAAPSRRNPTAAPAPAAVSFNISRRVCMGVPPRGRSILHHSTERSGTYWRCAVALFSRPGRTPACNSISTSPASTGPADRPASAPASPRSPSEPKRSVFAHCRSWITSSRWTGWLPRPTRCSRATPRSASWPVAPSGCVCVCSSRVSRIATPVCSRRPSPRSTCCRVAALSSASARRGTSVSTSASVCRSPRRLSDSNDSKRPSRSACRCGAPTTAPTTASTINWRPRFAAPCR